MRATASTAIGNSLKLSSELSLIMQEFDLTTYAAISSLVYSVSSRAVTMHQSVRLIKRLLPSSRLFWFSIIINRTFNYLSSAIKNMKTHFIPLNECSLGTLIIVMCVWRSHIMAKASRQVRLFSRIASNEYKSTKDVAVTAILVSSTPMSLLSTCGITSSHALLQTS